MAVLRPFAALRPPPTLAPRVVAPPYDVVDVAEARAIAAGNPDSFLHVSRPEIDLPDDIDPYDDAVYDAGRRALADFVARGVLVPDAAPTFTVYRQRFGDVVQTGVVGAASVDDYANDVIRRHELTRPDKELDRVRHIDALGAHDEPVFLLSPRHDAVEAVIADVVSAPPRYDLTAPDAVQHTLWVVDDAARIEALVAGFASLPRLYVADGHHRSAAALRVRDLRHARGADSPGSSHFPVVVFAADELNVMAYNRVVTDLGGWTTAGLREALGRDFDVRDDVGPVAPSSRHEYGVYVDGAWWRMRAHDHVPGTDNTVARLDVSVLQDRVLGPLLGISDPRTDARIGFVGGIRGTDELVRLVDSGRAAVAFSLCPTSTADLIDVADRDLLMPPKSTWFEPKLGSGLFLHPL